MYWVEAPDDGGATERAYEAFLAAEEAQDAFGPGTPEAEAMQEAVDAAYLTLRMCDVGYYQLNVWGMAVCCEAMWKRRMVFVSDGASHEDWASLPEVDINHDDGGAEYQKAETALLSRMEMEQVGIPTHKLCSNDGWVVTPLEITGAIAQLEMSGLPTPRYRTDAQFGEWYIAGDDEEGEPIEWWDAWIDWLKLAAEHGGFRVF